MWAIAVDYWKSFDALLPDRAYCSVGSFFTWLLARRWQVNDRAKLSASFTEWIHQPDLWRRLADSRVPMQFLAAGDDIRPSWPLQQLATLVPHGSFTTIPNVPHDFWATDPSVRTETITAACAHATRFRTSNGPAESLTWVVERSQ